MSVMSADKPREQPDKTANLVSSANRPPALLPGTSEEIKAKNAEIKLQQVNWRKEPRSGDPPFDINRLIRYRDNQTDPEAQRLAKELLARLGPLVLDEVQYRLGGTPEDVKIEVIPRQFLGLERAKLAAGMDRLKIENA